MEKVRTYKRILAMLLMPAMLLGIAVPVTPQIPLYAEEANTENPVVLDENGVLKIEGIDTITKETLGKTAFSRFSPITVFCIWEYTITPYTINANNPNSFFILYLFNSTPKMKLIRIYPLFRLRS